MVQNLPLSLSYWCYIKCYLIALWLVRIIEIIEWRIWKKEEVGWQVESNGNHENSQGNFCRDFIQVATENKSQMDLFI